MRLRFVAINLFFFLLFPVVVMGETQKSTLSSDSSMEKALKLYDEQKYPQAMSEFVECMKNYEKQGDTYYYCGCTGYIANIYSIYQDYQKAFHYLEKGYNKAVEKGYVSMQYNFLANLVKVCCDNNDLKGAQKYFKLQTEVPDAEDMTEKDIELKKYFELYNKARILTLEGKYDQAIQAHQATLRYAQEKKLDSIFVLFQQNEVCNLWLKEGRYDDVIEQGKKCLAEAQKLHNLELIANAYRMLTKASQYSNRTEEYKYFKEQYRNISDSVYNVPELNVASGMLYDYEDECNKEKISSLNSTIHMQIIALTVISVLVVVLIFLLFRILYYNRRLRNIQKIVLEQKRELEAGNKNYAELLNQYVAKLKKYENVPEEDIPQDKDDVSVNIPNEVTRKILQQKILNVFSDGASLSNPDFSLGMLASAVGSNTRYVSYIINEMYGKNFKAVINEMRIHKAENMLSNPLEYGNYTIQAIYESVGYTNAASFIRSFKKLNGMTPSEYQKIALLDD